FLGHNLLSLHAAMQHGERLVAVGCFVEIIRAERIPGRVHPEALLAADAVRVRYAFSYAIPDLARSQVDDQSASASISHLFIVVRNPALGDLDDQVHTLLAVRAHPAYWPHGMDLEVGELAGDTVHLAPDVPAAKEAQRLHIRIFHGIGGSPV